MSAENAATLPENVTAELADGVYRAEAQGNGLSVLKEGENFFVVEPATRHISRALGLEELTSTLRGVRSEVAAEGRMALKREDFSATDIEKFDYLQYNEIELDASEFSRVQSEALTWDAKNRNVMRTRTLSNGLTYHYVIDGDGIVHVYAREQGINIHEKGEHYADTSREGFDTVAEELRSGQGNDGGNLGAMQNGRESQSTDQYDHRTLRSDGKGAHRAGNSKNAAYANRRKKAREYHFDPDGSGHGTVTYSDGTTERFALPNTNSQASAETQQNVAQETEDDGKARRAEIAIDVWARENIPDYAGLNAPARGAVRATVRNARAHGISNEEVLVYARVAARSGLNISFDAAQAAGGDAHFDGRNTVYVNPNAPAARIQSKLMLHEGGHALFFKTKSGKKLLARAVEMADAKTAAEVREQYTKYYEKQNVDKSVYEPIIEEEIAAAGLESALGVDGAWEFILSKRPTAGEKLLSFFRGAARDYAGVGELSAEARKLLRTYQKAFAELSARNQGNNALTGINGEKVQVSETKKAADEGGRLARAKGKQRTYSYNELVRKGDLTGIVVKKEQRVELTADGLIDSKAVVDTVRNKCKTLQTARAGTIYYVDVPDISRRVEITVKGIKHGYQEGLQKNKAKIPDRAMLNARVALELPQLLKNSVEVNISDRSDNIDTPYAHIMIGTIALENDDGTKDYCAVRTVIEERINQNPVLAEMNVLGKLHAANAKKISPPNARGGNAVALTHGGTYTYSIADFLQNVKGVFDDTFSLDVYQRLGVPRAVNDFSKNMRFALPKDGVPKVPTWGKESYSFAEVAGEKLTAEEVADFQGTLEKKVGAERTKYKAKAKDFVFTRAASIYIDTVDELYGISHFLKNAGGVRDAAAIVNVARSYKCEYKRSPAIHQ